MQNNINEIIGKYTAGEKTLEETNAALKEAGVTEFHLVAMTDEERAAKKQREDEEGTIDIGRDTGKVLPKTPDMRRRMDLAGQVVIQETSSGYFAVTYNEDGYAAKSRRVTFAN